ncbi:MAG TPA: bifunctional phosphopantothenoylcysteine decarboxylase/phosphopantothenate--cysteine ligase CoaBC [Candidatus Hydrogenedentes bacterium]|jgi:phosphopantothenoylcysteine decarboxylase/phosphopantothenate--cysteine ligase|nr:bifunctional phosphopantothenoylcysteine decarboxylase/phosphopantothenate--cysteine ligase CoaBC [Candidatus Hydrogenedentota bacterium]MDY0031990.1 bifunctional phosphopantothenoylcysteine decarboxylase/phosphopantothenate--cysteine ligase CoaBC [FCB group bacterium]HNZ16964.1 bifunctional phosphopantothenoylcysteine decarboxylase/phosphopantothenate--cysteine ligase CoaBC [Candidatus Hydrogenedentota bacterium]HOH32652.1 bifunctional phosphopantothenoylcysteine decarboxylase/phosphopantoth
MKRTTSSKEIVLGVTGSIAAYKACEIASRLVESGYAVTPALTASAQELVGPATFEALTGRRVITGMFDPLASPEIEHIAVAQRAALFLIAPATANIIAKAARGIADDWLSTTLLATQAPILFAPAMNTNMYNHPATQENIAILKSRGCAFVGPGAGRLACGTVGIGRMVYVPRILEAVEIALHETKDLAGLFVVLTAGGTREPVDPVRFIGNRSSGKMGRALAMEALKRGARVAIIAGHMDVPPPEGAEVIVAETAQDMAEVALSLAQDADVFVGAAAVGDFRVQNPSGDKHKRSEKGLEIKLIENPDVISQVGALRRDGQVVVGFAAETTDLIKNAKSKIKQKQLDLIVANQVGVEDSGFGTETLRACFIDSKGAVEELDLLTKEEVATRLFDRVSDLLG